jgi:hypothetical protein
MVPSILVSLLQAAISLATGLTAFRLANTPLHRRYPVLFCYMVFSAVYSLTPIVVNTNGALYFWIWIYGQPIEWALDVLVVHELCRVILEKHPGLVTLGRWGMYFGVFLAGFLSYLSLLPHITSTMPARSRLVAYWVVAGRGVTLGLAIFLILMLLATSRYPVHLCRNVILNAGLFTLVFLSSSLEAIMRTIFDRRMNPWLAAALTGVEIACFFVWFFRLSADGEHTEFSWIRFGPEYEQRVLQRLDALNRIVTGGIH